MEPHTTMVRREKDSWCWMLREAATTSDGARNADSVAGADAGFDMENGASAGPKDKGWNTVGSDGP